MQTKHKQEPSFDFELKGGLLRQLVVETPHLFMTTALPSDQEGMIDDMTDRYNAEGKLIHVIRGTAAELKRLSALVEKEQQRSMVRKVLKL
jgi:hypothetical protein